MLSGDRTVDAEPQRSQHTGAPAVQTTAPDQASSAGGGFGRSVALLGNQVAVGAYSAADPGYPVYIYERQEKQWVLVATLVSSAGFSPVNSLDSMDWDANTLVGATTTGIAIFRRTTAYPAGAYRWPGQARPEPRAAVL